LFHKAEAASRKEKDSLMSGSVERKSGHPAVKKLSPAGGRGREGKGCFPSCKKGRCLERGQVVKKWKRERTQVRSNGAGKKKSGMGQQKIRARAMKRRFFARKRKKPHAQRKGKKTKNGTRPVVGNRITPQRRGETLISRKRKKGGVRKGGKKKRREGDRGIRLEERFLRCKEPSKRKASLSPFVHLRGRVSGKKSKPKGKRKTKTGSANGPETPAKGGGPQSCSVGGGGGNRGYVI